MGLIVGHIPYINCAPFFHFLRAAGFAGEIRRGVPSELNRRLAAGSVDVSPSSSFEYGRNWRQYLLLPGHSISSRGAVRSVLLFSGRPLEDLEGKEIVLTGESATSVNLLEIMLREFFGFSTVRCRVPAQPAEEVVAAGGTALLIGDRALQMALVDHSDLHVYDLGELWARFTGLPFVFALWILRREAAAKKRREVADLLFQLDRSRSQAFASLPALAAQTAERAWMGEAGLVDYWNCMSYDLEEDHLEGLRLFFSLCLKYGLLEEEPQIRFFE